jgi:hypothetical protein
MFVRFGKNCRYIKVQLHHVEGHDHNECEDWIQFEYNISLRELGSTTNEDVKMNFNSLASEENQVESKAEDADKNKDTNEVENEEEDEDKDDEARDDPNRWVKCLDDSLKKVADWLQLGMTSKECANILTTAIEYTQGVPHEGDPDNQSYEKPVKWNGQFLGELERVMTKFLNDEDGWAKDIEFVTKRIVAKLKIMDLIKVC